MRETFAAAMDAVFGSEGGYADHPRDPGGPTKYGITAATLGAWRKLGRSATRDEVRALTRAEAAAILTAQYAQPIRYDDLPAGLDYAAFDYAVNSGPAQAAVSLQRVLGVAQDGIVGANTLAAAAARPVGPLIGAYLSERRRFLRSLRTWPSFGKGWSVRLAAVEAGAQAMARGETQVLVPPPRTSRAPPKARALAASLPGRTAIVSALSIATGAVGQAKEALQPLVGTGRWIDMSFTVLTMLGVAGVVAGITVSVVAETRRIGEGRPS